ncbi:MAG: H-NS family nucleoid-associated regulatory protein [Candidatus Endonucleobacter sp. (ex Gigantidas childressi)]|nr:H-NS family nucleoid-associated regulatory protein [Candidatus Endonucleobacter sp. (ex Gigantidas childressi)]
MNIFDDLLSLLHSKTRIRSLFRDIDNDEMTRIINRMSNVLDEKIKLKDKESEKRAERIKMLVEIQKNMKNHGLSIDDLYGTSGTSSSRDTKKQRERYSFQYDTISGDTVLWYGSGVGRLPKDFLLYLERTGKKRMDCVISENGTELKE